MMQRVSGAPNATDGPYVFHGFDLSLDAYAARDGGDRNIVGAS